jgi:type I restriction enzyme, S subunit
LNTALYVVDFKGNDPRFVSYLLRNTLRNYRTEKAAVPGVDRNVLHLLKVRAPDRPTQESVVSILSTYDDLIENNRRRIALLEEAARMLYREWFVHFRFPGHEHIRINDSIPEGWERRTLGAIAETNRESYSAKELPDDINYIDISSVTQGRIVSKASMFAAEAPGRARRKARDGDIIWSNVRPNLRAYALILEPEETDVFSTGFTVLTAKEVPFTWLYQFVTTDSFVKHLVNHATGVGYPAVRPNDFERAAVIVPPKTLLTLFHDATESNLRMVAKLNLQSAKLAQARDLLVPPLVNGEIAV